MSFKPVECCSNCGCAVEDTGTETRYQCDYCGETYSDEDEAAECCPEEDEEDEEDE